MLSSRCSGNRLEIIQYHIISRSFTIAHKGAVGYLSTLLNNSLPFKKLNVL